MADNLRFYADKECKKPIEAIKWDNSQVTFTLVSGEIVQFDNAQEIGALATATVYVRNETSWRYGVTAIRLPKNVKYKIESAWLYPMVATKLTLTVVVKEDMLIENSQIEIQGYFMRENK